MERKIKLLSFLLIFSFSLFSKVTYLPRVKNCLLEQKKAGIKSQKSSTQCSKEQNIIIKEGAKVSEIIENYTVMTYHAVSGFYIMRFVSKKRIKKGLVAWVASAN